MKDYNWINAQIYPLKRFVHSYKNPDSEVLIAMCGKYTELIDSYRGIS